MFKPDVRRMAWFLDLQRKFAIPKRPLAPAMRRLGPRPYRSDFQIGQTAFFTPRRETQSFWRPVGVTALAQQSLLQVASRLNKFTGAKSPMLKAPSTTASQGGEVVARALLTSGSTAARAGISRSDIALGKRAAPLVFLGPLRHPSGLVSVNKQRADALAVSVVPPTPSLALGRDTQSMRSGSPQSDGTTGSSIALARNSFARSVGPNAVDHPAVQQVFPSPPDPQRSEERDRPDNKGASVSTLHIDGATLGRWAIQHLERALAKPAAGMTGVDPRVTVPRTRVSPF